MDWLEAENSYLGWLLLGLVLATLEMLVPGVYLIWLAVAAVITGAIAFVAAPPLAVQVIAFVSLSLIAAFSARRWFMDSPNDSSDPLLNNRSARLVGETAIVSEAIEGGAGRVHLGDSDWIAHGPDMAAGTRVRVTGVAGTALQVQPLNLLPGNGDAPPADSE